MYYWTSPLSLYGSDRIGNKRCWPPICTIESVRRSPVFSPSNTNTSQVPCQTNWHQSQLHFHQATQLAHVVKSASSAETWRGKNLYWIKSGSCAAVCGQVRMESNCCFVQKRRTFKSRKTKGWHLSVSLQKRGSKEPLFAYLNNKTLRPSSTDVNSALCCSPFSSIVSPTGFSIHMFSSVNPPAQWQAWDWDMSLRSLILTKRFPASLWPAGNKTTQSH